MYSLGVDVGGTFTDLVLFDEDKGTIKALKTSSTISNQAEGVITGINRLKVDMDEVKRVVHGMTVATNAILEGKVAKTGLITTKGFRDTIEIAKTNRKIVYDMKYQKPAPLITRPLRKEVDERLYFDGSVLKPIDEQEVIEKFKELLDMGIESLAICFLHSYRNPIHERKARDAVLKVAPPNFSISISSDVVPEYREYERFTTTVINANLMPVMERYIKSLENRLDQLGYKEDLYIMHSSGGIMTADMARAKPVTTILSGPVGGIVGASYVAEMIGFKNIITYDMGGTSTDVSLIENLRPHLTTLGEVKGYPIKTPFLDIKTIGAGGGSIAWLDGKNLRVGPISAGADPGPACYGKGGEEPTITDANLVLGRLNPDRELGEEIRMNKELSIKAIEKIAKEFPGYDVIKMANGIIKIVINNMAMAIHEISVQKGYDPREFVLVAFGGAGPLHAAQLAKELGMKKVLVPNIPGNLCALGLLASDTMINQVRTHIVKTREVDVKEIEDIFADMLDEAYKSFKDKGIAKEDIQFIRYMDMRYIGQAFEIHVPISNPITQESLEKAFYDQYEMTYGYADRKEPTEIVNIRVSALYRNPRPALSTEKSKPKGNPNWNTRKVFFEDTGFIDCKVAERDLLPYEIEFEGPAIIEEFGSTTVVLPNQKAKIDDLGNILIEV